jgi:putative intracellular protease/amidase
MTRFTSLRKILSCLGLITLTGFFFGDMNALAQTAPQQLKEETTVPVSKPLDIVFYLYPGMTALDIVGPYEVLRQLPGATVRFVAKKRGAVLMDSQALSLNADYSLEEIKSADILVVPGGSTGTPAQMRDKEVLDWIRQIHAKTKWTTSVCTGSLILGAAGLLKEQEATTHWAVLNTLAMFGAKPVSQRFVRQGKIITAAGVSAGIDMALKLAAMESHESIAKGIQLGLEYDPQPPFDTGSVEKAPPALVEKVKSSLLGNARSAAQAQQ